MSAGNNRIRPEVLAALGQSNDYISLSVKNSLFETSDGFTFSRSTDARVLETVLRQVFHWVEGYFEIERPAYFADVNLSALDEACSQGLEIYGRAMEGHTDVALDEVSIFVRLYWLIPDRNAYILNGNLVVDSCMLFTKKKVFERLLRYWVYVENDSQTESDAREVFKFLVEFFEQGGTSLGDKRQKTSRRNIECFERYWKKGDDRAIAGAYRVPHFDLAVVRDLLKAHISKFGRSDLDYWTSPSHLEMGQRLPAELARMFAHRSVDLMDGIQLSMVLKLPDLRVGAGFGAETG